jgi:transcriptional regulator with XRE-family HTH domain
VQTFDLSGTLRRIRRRADLSQRELADAIEVSQSAVAQAESGRRDLPVGTLTRAAALAGLRLALLDDESTEVPAMARDTVRDGGRRRFPAHLDTHHSDERPGRYEHRYDRPVPWFTVDRDRSARNASRRSTGTPGDHHPIRPGDSPAARRAQRQEDARSRAAEERRRRREAGELSSVDASSDCTCPPACDELEDRPGPPVHAPDCPCGCDLA